MFKIYIVSTEKNNCAYMYGSMDGQSVTVIINLASQIQILDKVMAL